MAQPTSDSSSLARHVASLYPLARMLTGPEAADALVERVYERAAEVPPPQRPADEQAWLFRLLIDVRSEDRASGGSGPAADADASFTDDAFRQSVATQTAERMLPVAFAACSVQERFVLAVDVLSEPSAQVLAAALDTTAADARSVRDNARSALRASLRDVLTGPERMLVDVALPDEALRELLRDLVAERFQPPPPALDARVSEVLDAAQARRAETEEASPSASESGVVASLLSRGRDALRSWATSRAALGVLLVVVFVGGGLAGLSYFSPPGPASQNVVELSVRRSSGLETALRTESASEAAAFIRRTWNRRLAVPGLEGASLQGVGRLSVEGAGEIPALLYGDDETGAQIVAYAYNYALVDRLGDRARLPRELRTELAANDTPLARQRSGRGVVLWRHQDEIFVMVAPNTDAEALRSRLRL